MPSEGGQRPGRGWRRVGCACPAAREPQELPLPEASAAAAARAGAAACTVVRPRAPVPRVPTSCCCFPAPRVGWRRLRLSGGGQLGWARPAGRKSHLGEGSIKKKSSLWGSGPIGREPAHGDWHEDTLLGAGTGGPGRSSAPFPLAGPDGGGEGRAPGPEGFNWVLGFCRPDTLWRKATGFKKIFNPSFFKA